MSLKKLFILLLIFPIMLLSIPGCTSAQEPQLSPSPPPPAPTGAIIPKLTFLEPPVLDEPVQLLATFTIREGYKRDATNTVAEILLDEGFELVDGNLKWTGDLLRGSSIEIKATIKAIKTGERSIKARAIAYTSEGKSYTGGSTWIYAYVSEDSAEVSDIPLRPKGIPSPEPAEPPEGTEAPPPVPPVERPGP